MKSVRSALAAMGIDTSRKLSVLGDLFGFFQQRVPPDPDPSARASVSLQNQLRALAGRHLNLNIITLGFDALSAHDNQEALNKIDYAIYRARNIYAASGLGVGRVEHYFISAGNLDGHDDLGDESEADDLNDEWLVPNDSVDVFIVRLISDPDFVGRSPKPGDCGKGGKDHGLVGGEINRDPKSPFHARWHMNWGISSVCRTIMATITAPPPRPNAIT